MANIKMPTHETNPDIEEPIASTQNEHVQQHLRGQKGHNALGTGLNHGQMTHANVLPVAGTTTGLDQGHSTYAGAGHGVTGVHAQQNDLNALPGEPKDERHIAHHPFATTTTTAGQKMMPVAADRSAPGNAPIDVGAPKLPYGVTHTHDAGAAGRTMPDKSVHLAEEHVHKTDLNKDGKESLGSKIKHAVTGGGYGHEK